MAGEQGHGRRFDWLFPVALVLGALLLALAYWLDARDGVPTMARGDTPPEAVAAGAIGMALFVNGIAGSVRALKARRTSDEPPST
ncbi:hypothetical protein [Microbacterium sp. LWH13-1.2]|uniref:hypothetical protein n=1 Tax=Microbacterium sp. LWH13-1.2 TaxID=3135260 RepID=UPI003138F68B